jgi:NAD(P)-dependent dehydrogenase (short-subunit alcohol dehydrogenase family)
MGRLDGKVAAVTGGASGIGEATVRRVVAEGASVAFCDRDGERVVAGRGNLQCDTTKAAVARR